MKPLSWKSSGAFFSAVRANGKILGIYVQPQDPEWLVMALETSNPPRGKRSTASKLDAVFNNHGHKLIGVYATPRDAFAASETFALKWIAEQKTIDPCSCEEIPT